MTTDTLNEKHSKLDKLQLGALFGLMIVGALFVYSATISNGSEAQKAWYAQIWFPATGTWHAYHGVSAHKDHVHVSVL